MAGILGILDGLSEDGWQVMVYAYFYRGQGIPGALVRWWTKSRFGHVAIAIESPGRLTRVYEALGEGVISRLSCSPPDCDAVEVPGDWVNECKCEAWLEAQIGKPYDWWAVVMSGVALRFPGWAHLIDTRQGAWNCSRLAESALDLWDYSEPCPATPETINERMMKRMEMMKNDKL